MPNSSRRLVLGVLLLVVVVFAAAGVRMGLKWKSAIDDVGVMSVPTVVLPPLPTDVPEPGIDANANAAPAPTPAPTSVPAPGDPINILLLGADARPGEDISRTDAIVLIRLDTRTDHVSMLSFPRDLWVPIPGYGKGRINSAYTIGERKIGPGYGPALIKQTVSQLLDVPVQHFVLINFDGFKTLIDELDGISIDVPKAIDDPAYPTDDYRTIKVHFDAGRQMMDSERALIYARTRHADSDFGRNQRQQQVLMAIFDRVREQGLLTQLTNLDQYTATLRDSVRTDLSRRQMLSLAGFGTRLAPENIHGYAITPNMLVALSPPATFAADPKAMRQLVTQVFGDPLASAGGENTAR